MLSNMVRWDIGTFVYWYVSRNAPIAQSSSLIYTVDNDSVLVCVCLHYHIIQGTFLNGIDVIVIVVDSVLLQ